jgi:hypothetical protein
VARVCADTVALPATVVIRRIEATQRCCITDRPSRAQSPNGAYTDRASGEPLLSHQRVDRLQEVSPRVETDVRGAMAALLWPSSSPVSSHRRTAPSESTAPRMASARHQERCGATGILDEGRVAKALPPSLHRAPDLDTARSPQSRPHKPVDVSRRRPIFDFSQPTISRSRLRPWLPRLVTQRRRGCRGPSRRLPCSRLLFVDSEGRAPQIFIANCT